MNTLRACVAALTLSLPLVLPTLAAEEQEPPKLLGPCKVDQLEQPPYAEWFRKGYETGSLAACDTFAARDL